jgi:hypothetical protein
MHSPSGHAVPSGAVGFEHMPVAGSQTPPTWHASIGMQTRCPLPVQTPLWQASFVVQGLPSSQVVPSGFATFEQAPVWGLHVFGSWH